MTAEFIQAAALAALTLVSGNAARAQSPVPGGTSLAWWAHVVGGFPEPVRTEYMDKAFDPVKGLKVIRYNIGGENPAHLPPNKQFLSSPAFLPNPASGTGRRTPISGMF